MQFMTSKRTARDTSISTMRTEEVDSDEFMRRQGFVEMTPEQSSRYDKFFRCADGTRIGPRRFFYQFISGVRARFTHRHKRAHALR